MLHTLDVLPSKTYEPVLSPSTADKPSSRYPFLTPELGTDRADPILGEKSNIMVPANDLGLDTSEVAPPQYNAGTRGVGAKMYEQDKYEYKPQDWTTEASRAAARNALARQPRRTSIHKAARQQSRRKQKPFAKTLRPGITVDTSVSRHCGAAPRQVFPQAEEVNIVENFKGAGGFIGFVSLADLAGAQEEERLAKGGWWQRARAARMKSKSSISTEAAKAPPADAGADRNGSDDGFRFRAKTMRAHDHDQNQETTSGWQTDEALRSQTAASDAAEQHEEMTTAKYKGLRPARLTLTDISPSDRPIQIGISIPSARLPEFVVSPQTAGGYGRDALGPAGHQLGLGDSRVETPTVIITPAREDSGWFRRDDDNSSDHRPRPASSIYSRATSYWSKPAGTQEVPPVPAVPSNFVGGGRSSIVTERGGIHAFGAVFVSDMGRKAEGGQVGRANRDSTVTAFEEDADAKRKDRVMSGCTLFEEDETPQTASAKSAKSLNGLTLETALPTPRRSRGWWNVITTPFEATPKGKSHFWTSSPTNEDDTPDVPMLPDMASIVGPQAAQQAAVSPPESTYSPSATTPVSASAAGVSPTTFLAIRSPISPENLATSEQSWAIYSPSLAKIPEDTRSETAVNTPESRFISEDNLKSSVTVQPTVICSHPSMHGSPPKSHFSVFSPDESDLTITLGDASTEHNLPAENSENPSTDVPTQPPAQVMTSPVDENSRSPTVGETPVVALASVGTVHAARTVGGDAHQPGINQPLHFYSEPPEYQRHGPDSRSAGVAGLYGQPGNNYPLNPISHPQYQDKDEYAHERSRGGRRSDNPFRRSKDRDPGKRKKKRVCLWSCLAIFILAIIALIVGLAVGLTRKPKNDMPVESRWLNLTGYPPIPTGISTVARVDSIKEVSGCVNPSTVWSCAVPKEEQESIAPNAPNQPNFRLEIRFVNGSISNSSATQTLSRRSSSRHFHTRDTFLDTILNPSPASPPSKISASSATQPTTTPSPSKANPHPSTRLTRIPPRFPDPNPLTNPDGSGTAAPANLYPLPTAQPLRLFDRGLPTEHYGFYTYFERSIFLRSLNSTAEKEAGETGNVAADLNGGAAAAGANFRCTWTQTRFRVQIWTRQQTPLLGNSSVTVSLGGGASGGSNKTSSANTFAQPGSFPTRLDGKMVYCYALDERGRYILNEKGIQPEQRSFGGTPVNPAQGPFGDVPVSLEDGGPGGIDGGSGGCECQWVNWQRGS
ncbi:hypothetical protein H2199_002593 [Coniosporium tulheliwenetii]|uniref:Uncharacterized protein n=1 Tax=Coniosporium tulheliwenetii TaxID=3383036 RepID=A0ACC2ZFC1_9PEZI|nr:hypothetical protein H2199_002593 [Cladosporium sp. JES 115]